MVETAGYVVFSNEYNGKRRGETNSQVQRLRTHMFGLGHSLALS
jgi:hypothetical protein